MVATAGKGGSHEKTFGGKNFSNRSHHHTNNRPRQRPTSLSNAPNTPTTPTTPTAPTALSAPTGNAVASRSGYQLEAEEPCTGTRRPDQQRSRRRERIFPGYHHHDDDHHHHHHYHHHRHRNRCRCKRMLPAAFAHRQRLRWRQWPHVPLPSHPRIFSNHLYHHRCPYRRSCHRYRRGRSRRRLAKNDTKYYG